MSTFFSTGSLNLTSGTNDSIRVQANDSSGNPVDITGFQFFLTVKSCPSNANPDLYLIQTSHSLAISGSTSFPIVPADTISLLPGKYFYQISSQDAYGNIISWTEDNLFIQKGLWSDSNYPTSSNENDPVYFVEES